MNFVFHWTTKRNKDATHAIRKRKSKEQEAGKEIELNLNQKSDTHFFLVADKPNEYDTIRNIRKINEILKTITYEYIYKQTEKKSTTKYLPKKDIENIIKNIEEYKNKTIIIETAFSKVIQVGKNKLDRELFKKWNGIFEEGYGYQKRKKILLLLEKNIEKEKELKKKRREAEIEIKKLKKEIEKTIEKIQYDIAKSEEDIKTEKEKIEKVVFNILQSEQKKLKYIDNEDELDFQNQLKLLYDMAKTNRQIKAGNKRQKKYRVKKSVESSEPKRKVGRPKKNKSE